MDLSLGVLCTECRSLSGSCHWLYFTSHSLSLGAKFQMYPALPKVILAAVTPVHTVMSNAWQCVALACSPASAVLESFDGQQLWGAPVACGSQQH